MTTPAPDALEHAAIPWLFAAALASLAPHFLHQPLWLSALAGLLLLWGGESWRSNRRPPGAWLLALLAFAAGAGILLEYRSLFGRDAGVALLVVGMALKLLELKSRRDAMVVVTLGYFLLLTHYFYSQSIATGAWLLLALWLITATLVRLHGGPACRARTALGQAALLGAQALPFLLVLYLLFPRIDGPLWGLPQDAHAGLTGLSDSMAPGDISQLARSGEIAFRVRFAGPLPPLPRLYWRGPVLESFDGRHWERSRLPHPAADLDALSTPIAYRTTLEASGQRWLLALDAPAALPPDARLDGTLTATRRQPITSRRRLDLAASLDYRFNADEAPAILRLNRLLPPGVDPRSRELAAQWRRQENSPQSVVDRALRLFADGGFAYTLRPPLLGDNGIDDFLFRTKRGFCEHYAAAFVFLMRAAGIPARVVTGYQGGERNPVDGYLVVRQSDAHAWAEVWLAGRGWVRVDPTAVVSPARIDEGIADALPAGEPLPALVRLHGGWLGALRDRWEAVNNAWNQRVLGYDAARQRELLSRLGLPEADWRGLASLLFAAMGGLLAAVTGWALYRKPRLDPAARLWRKALRHLARRRVNCPPWETPLALARRLRDERPELAGAVDAVVAAYLAARYGKPPADLNRLRHAIAQLP